MLLVEIEFAVDDCRAVIHGPAHARYYELRKQRSVQRRFAMRMPLCGENLMSLRLDHMSPADWLNVRAIYEEGIATGMGTFETEAPTWEEWDASRLPHSRLLARDGRTLGWAALSAVSKRACYAGVAEVGIYVATVARGRGIGRILLEALIESSEEHGIWTLQGVTIAENAASLALQSKCGFRVVGRRERIGKLAGVWRDTILTERRSKKVGMD